MNEKIKKFFARKKLDAKFKLAGPGHKLTESTASSATSNNKKPGYIPQTSRELTDATKQAAEAALARMGGPKKDYAFNTSLAAIQAQVRRELEAESKNKEPLEVSPRRPVETELIASPLLAVNGIYYKCPIISEEVLSKDEWRVKIKEFLLEQLEEERGITACLMIHSCNYNRAKVADCVNVLCKYLENIIGNPEETKFHKIRCSNATFYDKVLPIFGALDLLLEAGFSKQILEHNGNDEEFYVFDEKKAEAVEKLLFLRDSLRSEDKIELELDRNLQVLSPAQATKRNQLPLEFYALTPEEIKREQQQKADVAEKQMVLRTKAMREKEELREIRKYKFSLVRIRFPDGLYLQGTFSVYEKLIDVINFVTENLDDANSFLLLGPTGHKFEEDDYNSTLFDLRLVPATILNFQWNCETSSGGFLKPEVMILVQSM